MRRWLQIVVAAGLLVAAAGVRVDVHFAGAEDAREGREYNQLMAGYVYLEARQS